MGAVMEQFESERRQRRRQLVEELPGQRLRDLLRREVAAILLLLLLVLLDEPVEMSTAPTRSTRACNFGGEMRGDRLQAQRQQSGRHRLRADNSHLYPLSRAAYSSEIRAQSLL